MVQPNLEASFPSNIEDKTHYGTPYGNELVSAYPQESTFGIIVADGTPNQAFMQAQVATCNYLQTTQPTTRQEAVEEMNNALNAGRQALRFAGETTKADAMFIKGLDFGNDKKLLIGSASNGKVVLQRAGQYIQLIGPAYPTDKRFDDDGVDSPNEVYLLDALPGDRVRFFPTVTKDMIPPAQTCFDFSIKERPEEIPTAPHHVGRSIGSLVTPTSVELGTEKAKYRAERKRVLGHHMAEIASDRSGSNPEDYLAPEEVAILQHLVQRANIKHWPNAPELHLENMKKPFLPRRKPETRIFDEQGNVVKGYSFGKLSIANHLQEVAICSDGKLRSLRGAEIHGDWYGWGKLPDADLLNPVLNRGDQYGVEYQSRYRGRTLHQILNDTSGLFY